MSKYFYGVLMIVFSSFVNAVTYRDPTSLPYAPVKIEQKEEAPRPHILEMIMVTPDEKYAIIDGFMLHVGDYLGDWVVKDISDYLVVLSSSKGVKELRRLALM